jgi:hypothetical protein
MGMLLDPGQLVHKLPTPKQISRFQHDIQKNGALRHMIVARVSTVRKDVMQIQATVKALDVAFVSIRKQLAQESKASQRVAAADE